MNNTDTTTDNRKRTLYIISFGDSRVYRLRPSEDLSDFARYEKRLNHFLADRFPGETFAYFTTPRLEKVEDMREEQFASYPYLDESALDEVEDELLREVKVMHAEKRLDCNAPWDSHK